MTPETQEESKRLARLWATRSHPTQAVFGEVYGIGNQSAVGQFLRGEVPLSLKAARGFAIGLGVRLEDFTPRLAAEAAAISSMVPGGALHPEVAVLAHDINQLPERQRELVLMTVRNAVALAGTVLNEDNGVRGSPNGTDGHAEIPTVRRSA